LTAEFSIRPAVVEDVADIARLHRAVWCDTYRDPAPAEVYRLVDEVFRLWRSDNLVFVWDDLSALG
jgi:hypothetical protein